ncbi:MAG: hypothetical protein U5L72_01175 [Bacteroidales bacterium]|nr:hypothetical protein [Bacteroidales bacterium]
MAGNRRAGQNYKELKPGDYTFMARAARPHGAWTGTPVAIDVSINPPWYLSNIAYLGYFLMFGLLIYALPAVDLLINKETVKDTSPG